MSEPYNDNDIAIIGLAGRFPGALDVTTFWQNVRDGVESVTTFNDEELLERGVPQSLLENPSYVKSGAVLDDMELFDAAFFGFSPKDAAIMDPQHRHFLEVAWTALEQAGYDPGKSDAAVGVFAGSGHNAYLPYNLLSNPELLDTVGFFLLRHTGNDKDFLTTRVSYELNLTGPSVNVQTACSTSLVATHLACQSLLNGECDMALAGGVTVELPHRVGYLYKEGEVTSPDGRCRPFDAEAGGTFFGSGAGVVVLKRANDAVSDGDYVHAVIRATAVNNDGSGKVSYLAPSVDAQAAAVAEALALADIDPETVTYVEAHGTATPLGDPIEVAALTQAFATGSYQTEQQFCALGSVKGNIGHLDTAAGVAGLIKTVEALKHKALPPSLHFERPNPALNLEESPFYVNAELREWATDGVPRRAGVTSLGVGGTNAHVILEEARVRPPSGPARRWQLLPLSARTPEALEQATTNLATFLETNPDANLADIAYTLQTGRRAFEQRRVIVSQSVGNAAATLHARDITRTYSQQASGTRSVAFMFAGGGAQYPNMGAGLYEQEPVYRNIIDRCLELLGTELGGELRHLLSPNSDIDLDESTKTLARPSRALPALFVTQVAQAALWRSWGVEPEALIGHSMGEYTAAYLAGVFSLEDALAVVTERGRLFEQVAEGGMLSVLLSADELTPLLGEDLSIAAVNAPSLCVVSGPKAMLTDLELTLSERGVDFQRVHIGVAAHSAMLEPILGAFENFLQEVMFSEPRLPFISNLTGGWADPAEVVTPAYWVKHLRHTVRFAEGLGTLLAEGDYALLEVGPGKTLASLAHLHPDQGDALALTSLRHPKEKVSDLAFMLTSLGRLWLGGVQVDWNTFYAEEKRQRVPLPTYPFERQRYWIEPGERVALPGRTAKNERRALEDWFSQPVWKPSALPVAEKLEGTVVVFMDELGLGEALVDALAGRRKVVQVGAGQDFAQTDVGYTLNPGDAGHYERLVEALARTPVTQLVHLWNVTESVAGDNTQNLNAGLDRSFYSLLFLGQVLGTLDKALGLTVVSNNVQQVAGESVTPHKAALLGPCKVIPQELPKVQCRSVDIVLPEQARLRKNLAASLVAEMFAGNEPVVAYRAGQRFIPDYEPVSLPEPAATSLKQGGAYLITGGLGGIGFVLAEHLLSTLNAKVVLLGRTRLPEREAWDGWLAERSADDPVSQRLRKLRALESLGGEVLALTADITRQNEVRGALEQAKNHFGTLNGVFHTAGVIDDGLIGLKSKTEAAAVLAPKVQGTLVLDRVLETEHLDFFLLFSSTSALLGLEGQVDYTAANAFLDAYARYKYAKDGTPTCALNWGAWQRVGMAARLAGAEVLPEILPKGEPSSFPHFDAQRQVQGVSEYTRTLSPQRDWLLGEHRTTAGVALLPGTAYLSFAHAAFSANTALFKPTDFRPTAFRPAELRDVVFLQPFTVADHAEKALQVRLEPTADLEELEITLSSESVPQEREHVRGRIAPLDAAPPPYPIKEVLKRCPRRVDVAGTADHKHMAFGDRWKNVRTVHYGEGEAVVSLDLPETFVQDLNAYPLHPALLDMATGKAQALIPEFNPKQDFYVPISYARVQVYASLPPTFYSHVRLSDGATTTSKTVSFDVTLTDSEGKTLLNIERFTMKQVGAHVFDTLAEVSEVGGLRKGQREMARLGIRPDEGLRALERVLAAPRHPQLIVSPQDFRALIQSRTPDPFTETEAAETPVLAQARPNLATAYVAPQTETEEAVAAVWQDVLGIAQVGVHDNFFELGGHSLLLTQVVTRVRKKLERNLTLALAFEQPTIAGMLESLNTPDSQETPAVRQVTRVARSAYRIKPSELE